MMIIDYTYYAFLLVRARDNQSRPSKRPSPVVAIVLWMYQLRPLMVCSPSLSVTSAAVIALGKSYLFANTRMTASRSSSSLSMR